jgi:succinate dehydrogenase / fumarate reductase membrane anchor subunit
MSESRVSYRTPLSRALGYGSAHLGVGRFIQERVTAIALVPLCLWAIWAALKVGPLGYAGAVAFLQSPFNAVMAVLLIAVACRHMQMGMQVIVEDYIHNPNNKIVCLLINGAIGWLAMVLGVISVLKVAVLGLGVR